jgi:heme exporter protein C
MTHKTRWIYKTLGMILLIYALVGGLSIQLPYELPIIYESIRNLFYHVSMWFTMMFILLISFIYSLRYLKGYDPAHDRIAVQAAHVGIAFGMLGIFTGMLWANETWGAPWVRDPKLNGAAMSLLVYFAYMILRSSIGDEEKRARISAVYNIFAFVLMIIFIGILPRFGGESLHPGQAGSPMTVAELDPTLRMVFYPAILGWLLLGIWILEIRVRIRRIHDNIQGRQQ